MKSSSAALLFVCSFAVFGLSSSGPVQQQLEDSAAAAAATTAGGGFGTVLWSVLDDCFADESAEPAAVCLKSKALTALDRALSKPTVTVADGLVLSARGGKSLQADPLAEKADRAALDAVKDSDRKSAMLDDMLVTRMDRLMSSRTIVLEAPEEGRGKKKNKGMQQAMMMAGMMAVAVMGPMAMKMIGMMAMKALIIAKVALVLSGIMALKKLLQSQQGGGGGGGGHESESVSHHYARSLSAAAAAAAHDMAYSSQKQ